MQRHLFDSLSRSAGERAARQFITRTMAPGARDEQDAIDPPTAAMRDLEASPPDQKTVKALVEELSQRSAPSQPWYGRELLVNLLSPALTVIGKLHPKPAHRAFCRLLPAKDYRATRFIGALDGLSVAELSEHGTFPMVDESSIDYETAAAVQRFGRILKISCHTMVNDADCGFFAPAASALMQACYRKEAATVYAALESNPALSAGGNLFDESNSVTAASEPTVLAAGFEAFANLAFANGELVDATPTILLIPASWSVNASDIVADLRLTETPKPFFIASGLGSVHRGQSDSAVAWG